MRLARASQGVAAAPCRAPAQASRRPLLAARLRRARVSAVDDGVRSGTDGGPADATAAPHAAAAAGDASATPPPALPPRPPPRLIGAIAFDAALDDRISSGEFTDAGSTKERVTRPVRKFAAVDRLGLGRR